MHVQAPTPSRSILYTPTGMSIPRTNPYPTETCLISSYEFVNSIIGAQIVARAMESVRTARGHLGQHVVATFLRWRVEDDVLLIGIGIGIGNLKGVSTSSEALPLTDDGRVPPSTWYRAGRYPAVDHNTYKPCLTRYRWGADMLAEFAIRMCKYIF